MEIIMKKEKHSSDKITEQTLHEILMEMKYTLNHLEDITADDRALLVKLVKQNNTIVEYLKTLEIEIVDGIPEYQTDSYSDPLMSEEDKDKSIKTEQLREMLDAFLEKRKDLKEFEKQLKKYKHMLTPGQIGDA